MPGEDETERNITKLLQDFTFHVSISIFNEHIRCFVFISKIVPLYDVNVKRRALIY